MVGNAQRLPGYGEVNWAKFVAGLSQVGYDYVLCIEHEDRRFEGTDQLVKEGFLIARNQISVLLPKKCIDYFLHDHESGEVSHFAAFVLKLSFPA